MINNGAGEQATERTSSLWKRFQLALGQWLASSAAGRLLCALHLELTVALVLPTVVAAALGSWQVGRIDWLLLGFAVATTLFSALAFQLLTAYQDFQQSLSADARPAADTPGSMFDLQKSGVVPPVWLLNTGAFLYTLSVLCGLWLALFAGWPILFFGTLALLFQFSAVISPARLAYRGAGLGEACTFLAFGLLPLVSTFFAQTQVLSWLPVLGGLPISLLLLLVVLSQQLSTLRRDWLIGKRTLAVLLGPPRSIDFNVLVTMLAYASVLAVTTLARLPLWYLGGLATLPLAMGVFSEIDRNLSSPWDAEQLCSAAFKALFWTTLLSLAALAISRPG
jgi:1,4-dihydroxy-2-naphthoate octaprenyltransferase